MLSNASKYAIRSVLYLAENSSIENKFGVKTIAEILDIPSPFIAKLLQKLAKCGVVSSAKGPNGGFYMNEENLEKNVCNIIYELDGDEIFEGCFMGLPKCDGINPCPVHHIVAPFKAELMKKFESITISEYSKEIKVNGSYLTLKM